MAERKRRGRKRDIHLLSNRPPLTPTRKPFVRKVEVAKPAPSKFLQETPPGKAAVVTASGIKYLDRGDHVPEPEPVKPKREKKPRVKNDPKLVSAARELRDRYLEQFNSGLSQGALPAGKYAVGRMIEVGSRQYAVGSEEDARLLPSANCLPPTDLAA